MEYIKEPEAYVGTEMELQALDAKKYPVGTTFKVIDPTTHKILYIAESDGTNWNTY